MRPSLPLLLLATGGLLLAGCLGPAQPAPQPAPEPEPEAESPARVTAPVVRDEPEPRPIVYPFQGALTAGVGASGLGYVSPTGSADPHIFVFPVYDDAVAVVAEVRWEDPLHDLDLELATPQCDTATGQGQCLWNDDGAPLAGDTPAQLVVRDPAVANQPGDWLLLVWAKNAVNVPFDAVVTVFYEAPPPEGWSAWEMGR